EGTGEISIGGGITVTGPILQPFYLDLYNISDLLARGLIVKEFIQTEKGSGFKVLNSSNYDKINTLLDSEINHAYDDYVPPKYPNEIEHIPTPPDTGYDSSGIPINTQTLVSFVREVMTARGDYKSLYEKLNKEDIEDYDNVLVEDHTLKFFANGTLKKTIDLSELVASGTPGPQGPKGEPGEPFKIVKIYESVDAMNKDFSNGDVKENEIVLINTGNVEDEDNAKLYIKGADQYKFLVDLSGKQIEGPRGPEGPKGEPGTPGEQGPQGLPGTNGTDGKSIEMRNDQETHFIQWRYVGSEDWTNIISTESLRGSEGPQGPKGADGA
ncbi:collagen-like protein, partial [Arthrospira platensis SPKY2]